MLDQSDAEQTMHRRGWMTPGWMTPLRLMLVVTGVWTVGMTVRGVLQHVRFNTTTFDIGIFAQGTWLLSQVKEPFVTLRGLHVFADHSSYILILVAPLYALIPNAGTLIVLTVLSLGVSAPLVYLIGRHAGAGQVLSAVTALLLLISPAVLWQIYASFHPEVFAIPLILGAVVLVQRDRSGWAIAAVVLALTVKEDAGLLVVPLGLAIALVMGKRRIGLVLTALGAVAFLLNFLVLLPAWSPTGELLYTGRYAYLGDSMVGIVWGLATSPDVWWTTVTSWQRLGYVAALVLAMPLCILGWRWLLVGVPVLAANLLSLHWYQYRIQSHYTAYLIVVVAVAAAYGAARFDGFGQFRRRRQVLVASVVIPVIVWAVASPIVVWAKPHPDQVRSAAMLALVPDDAVVSATTNFTPHLANREKVYLFPNPWIPLNYGAAGTPSPDPATIEWVAVRTDVETHRAELISELTSSGEYSVFHEDGPFLLLQRTEDG